VDRLVTIFLHVPSHNSNLLGVCTDYLFLSKYVLNN